MMYFRISRGTSIQPYIKKHLQSNRNRITHASYHGYGATAPLMRPYRYQPYPLGTPLAYATVTTEAATADTQLGIAIPQGIVEDPFWENGTQPKKCIGCGSSFQTAHPTAPGYVSIKKLDEFSGGRQRMYKRVKGETVDIVPKDVEVTNQTASKYRMNTNLLLCRRCYRLQHYKRLDKMEDVQERKSVSTTEVIDKVLSGMRKGSLVLKVVDILNIEGSIVPELFDGCKNRKMQVIWVINKIDCLPKDVNLQKIKLWLRQMVRQIKNTNFHDIILVSSTTGFNFEKLEERMKQFVDVENPKNIYVVGRVNAGKSTFVMRFLKFIGYRHLGSLDMKRGLGGATRSAIPGTTLDFISFGLPKGFKVVDTPGIPSINEISTTLRSQKDVYASLPVKRIQPVASKVKAGSTLLIGGLVRVDVISGIEATCTCYFSRNVTLMQCKTRTAERVLQQKVGNALHPPYNLEDYRSLQPLQCHRVEVFACRQKSIDEIVIAGLGWIGISGDGRKQLDIWVPNGVRVLRRPSMIPHSDAKRGITSREKGSMANG